MDGCTSWHSLATGTILYDMIKRSYFPTNSPQGVYWEILPKEQYFSIHTLGQISGTHPCVAQCRHSQERKMSDVNTLVVEIR